jgi:hypothetical protein
VEKEVRASPGPLHPPQAPQHPQGNNRLGLLRCSNPSFSKPLANLYGLVWDGMDSDDLARRCHVRTCMTWFSWECLRHPWTHVSSFRTLEPSMTIILHNHRIYVPRTYLEIRLSMVFQRLCCKFQRSLIAHVSVNPLRLGAFQLGGSQWPSGAKATDAGSLITE